ncbi:transposase [Acinetobacter sp. NCu2D-2]|uniref:transposase n=1 Tax=Acinetobacter sp. NCu2D-2 TaxID=1608473 RepID=UPI0007CDDB1A|nr:transposase [Acinetobacter sp. NCu2D-2]
MKILNQWYTATAVNGCEINVKVVPLKRKQSTLDGFIWVDVGSMIQLSSGEEIQFNLDGKSFYTGVNQLYRLQ